MFTATVPALRYEGGVRLVGGPYRSEGTLEVFMLNRWYRIQICGTARVSADAARAVCHQLGYTHERASAIRYVSYMVLNNCWML